MSEAVDSKGKSEFDIEDLMGTEYFRELAEESYAEDIPQELTYNSNIPRVCKQFEQAMKAASIKKSFVKARPARLFMQKVSNGSTDSIPNELLDNFESLFKLINKRMK